MNGGIEPGTHHQMLLFRPVAAGRRWTIKEINMDYGSFVSHYLIGMVVAFFWLAQMATEGRRPKDIIPMAEVVIMVLLGLLWPLLIVMVIDYLIEWCQGKDRERWFR